MRRTPLVALALLLTGCPPGGPTPTGAPVELRVLVAASLTEPMRALGAAFERAHPGVRVLVSVGSSTALERQVVAGARADVFVSAAAEPVDRLIGRGLLDPATRQVVAKNDLVVVVPVGGAPERARAGLADSTERPSQDASSSREAGERSRRTHHTAGSTETPATLADLRRLERVAVGQPGVPVGEYAREALARAGAASALEGKLIGYPDEPAVLSAVAAGAAPAGFVYASSLVAHPRRDAVRRAFVVDPSLHAPVSYPAAVGAESAHPEVARAFLAFVQGPEGRAALQAAGFTPPAPAPAPAR